MMSMGLSLDFVDPANPTCQASFGAPTPTVSSPPATPLFQLPRPLTVRFDATTTHAADACASAAANESKAKQAMTLNLRSLQLKLQKSK